MLQQLRLKAGLSQTDVAHALHVDRSAVAKWENGKNYPSIQLLIPLARLYLVSLERLVEVITEGVHA